MSLTILKVAWEASFKDSKLNSYEYVEQSFHTNDDHWKLVFCPAGSKIHFIFPGECTSFYFINLNRDTEASIILTLLNQKNEVVLKKTLEKTKFIVNTHVGFPRFVQKSFILDPKNNIVKDNKLTFICEFVSEKIIIKENKKTFSRVKEFNDFEKLFDNQNFSDVVLTVDGKNFYGHKCILASRSPVFNAMFQHDMKEKSENAVTIEDIEIKVFQELMRFLYTGEVEEIEKIVCELLYAAEKYSVEGLVTLCEDSMLSSIDDGNAIRYLYAADLNNAIKIKTEIIKWISLRVKIFLKKPEFKILGETHPELFYEIIEENYKE